MTQKNREIMQRAIGIIEGVSFGVDRELQNALVATVEMLDNIFDDEEERSNA